MKEPDEDDRDYRKNWMIFKKYDVRYFLYNGGNDSMDTCDKISRFMSKAAGSAASWACPRP
jgi:6-phosphofructokinase 1